MNLGDRQQEIFEIVVEEFIKSARPVGSEFLAENYDLEVSPATVRNDLAFLEELGLLTNRILRAGGFPHPAAGIFLLKKSANQTNFHKVKWHDLMLSQTNCSILLRK